MAQTIELGQITILNGEITNRVALEYPRIIVPSSIWSTATWLPPYRILSGEYLQMKTSEIRELTGQDLPD